MATIKKITHQLFTGTTIRLSAEHIRKLNAIISWHQEKGRPGITMISMIRWLIDFEYARRFGTVFD